MSSSVSSSALPRKARQVKNPKKEIARLEQEILAVRSQRKSLEKVKPVTRALPPVIKPKPKPSHPNLRMIVAEMAFSPYLTKPTEPYTTDAMRMVPKLAEIRFNSKMSNAPRVSKKDIPCDLKEAKAKWKAEIVNFNEAHSVAIPNRRAQNRNRSGSLSSMGSMQSMSTTGSMTNHMASSGDIIRHFFYLVWAL